jgi:hypothetical protein
MKRRTSPRNGVSPRSTVYAMSSAADRRRAACSNCWVGDGPPNWQLHRSARRGASRRACSAGELPKSLAGLEPVGRVRCRRDVKLVALVVVTFFWGCGVGPRSGPSETLPPPIQTVDQCSLLTQEEVTAAVDSAVRSVRLGAMRPGGEGCLYDTDSAYDQIAVFVADNWQEYFHWRKRQQGSTEVRGVGDAAFSNGSQVGVLVGSRYLSVGARLWVENDKPLIQLAKHASERLEKPEAG